VKTRVVIRVGTPWWWFPALQRLDIGQTISSLTYQKLWTQFRQCMTAAQMEKKRSWIVDYIRPLTRTNLLLLPGWRRKNSWWACRRRKRWPAFIAADVVTLYVMRSCRSGRRSALLARSSQEVDGLQLQYNSSVSKRYRRVGGQQRKRQISWFFWSKLSLTGKTRPPINVSSFIAGATFSCSNGPLSGRCIGVLMRLERVVVAVAVGALRLLPTLFRDSDECSSFPTSGKLIYMVLYNFRDLLMRIFYPIFLSYFFFLLLWYRSLTSNNLASLFKELNVSADGPGRW